MQIIILWGILYLGKVFLFRDIEASGLKSMYVCILVWNSTRVEANHII